MVGGILLENSLADGLLLEDNSGILLLESFLLNSPRNLFIHGSTDISVIKNIDLFINGPVYIDSDHDLFLHGHIPQIDNIDLFEKGHYIDNNNIDLYTSGLGLESQKINLFVSSLDVFGQQFNLFINGVGCSFYNFNLFIYGIDSLTNNNDLFILGADHMQGFQDLLTKGHEYINESLDLYLRVEEVKQLDLVIHGSQPPPTIACPDLDPLAAIQIGADLITIYQERIDSLINQLGKNVLFIFDPIIEPCTNCVFDIGENRSTGIYKIGGPIPFTRGQKCPYCKGQGFLERAVEKCVKCLIKWNPKEFKNYGISVQKNHAVVRLKGFLTDAPHMVKAKTAIVDHDIERAFKLIVRLIQGPIPVGLREDRYCVSYWELIDS